MKDRVTSILRSLVFVIFALVLCALVFQMAGYNAALMLASVADGAFLRPGAIEQSLRWALPLFITAAGVSISFRAGSSPCNLASPRNFHSPFSRSRPS